MKVFLTMQKVNKKSLILANYKVNLKYNMTILSKRKRGIIFSTHRLVKCKFYTGKQLLDLISTFFDGNHP